jgi:alanyl aminopeptidase
VAHRAREDRPAAVQVDAHLAARERRRPRLLRLERTARDAAAIASDRKRLTAPERIGFVRNLAALERAGLVPVEDYLPLLFAFRDDDEPEVVDATLDALNTIRESLVAPEVAPLFAEQVRRLLHPVSNRIGMEPKSGELPAVGVLRPKLLVALGDLGDDPDVQRWANALTERVLAGKPADQSLAEAALPLSAQRGSAPLERRMRDRFEATTIASERGRYFSALGSFRDPAVVQSLLDYALRSKLVPQEVYTLPSELARYPANRGMLQDWMETNYGRILQHIPPHMVARMMPIVRGCEPERVERARAFFADSSHTFQGASFVMDRTADAVAECARMAERDRARFGVYLRSAAGRPLGNSLCPGLRGMIVAAVDWASPQIRGASGETP